MNRRIAYLTALTISLTSIIIYCCRDTDSIRDTASRDTRTEQRPAVDILDDILGDNGQQPGTTDTEPPEMPDDNCRKIHINSLPGGYLAKVFNDSNHLHLATVERLGITPISNAAEAWTVDKPIVRVASCEAYYIDRLTMSLPYLIPSAERLLHDIGMAFSDSLKSRGGGGYRIKVTSLLRTEGTVSRLRRRNRNAVEQSAHLYGTTFDISYIKFAYDGHSTPHTQEDLKNLLGEVLYDMRERGRCFVKYERRQGCFHISTRQ